MNIAVIDDNKVDRDELIRLLGIVCREADISADIRSYSNGEQFLKDLSVISFSIVFMDICMEPDGITLSQALREYSIRPFLIFTTNSNEHYAEAFSVHAFDYLLKPVTQERLRNVINDILRTSAPKSDPAFVIPQKNYLILYSDIRYIYSDANYLILVSDTQIRFRMTFSDLKKKLLNDSRFLVINRGVMVNMEHVRDIKGINCIMDDDAAFPLNSRTHSSIRQTYIRWQFERRAEMLSKEGTGI